MSLRICPRCGEPFSAASTTCPHCGAKDVVPILVFVICLGLTVAVIAYALWFAGR